MGRLTETKCNTHDFPPNTAKHQAACVVNTVDVGMAKLKDADYVV